MGVHRTCRRANEIEYADRRSFRVVGLLAGHDHFHLLSTHAPLTDAVVGDIDHLMHQRWGVLLSIDDLVAGLVKACEDAGVADNTCV